MKKVLKKRYIFILLILISIGFAYLTSNLSLSGISSIFRNTWDVHFENVVVSEGSVEANTPVISNNDTSVTFTVVLEMPGDFYEFTVDAVNAGTIDAMLDTYTSTTLTEDQQKYLEYTVTYADGEELAQYQELNAGDTLTYKIRLYYKLDIQEDDLPSEDTPVEITFTSNFIQADSNRIKRRAENTLYNVLKNEAESGGLALKYTGAHQDSMDASLSTKDIYHWYADNDTDGTAVTNKNNVIFANHCWQMIRTTDTGGVKLLYNGEVDNDQCLDTRGNHVGYESGSSINISSNYWYGTDYLFDGNYFKIAGITQQASWNDSTSLELIGKYTCMLNNENGTCSTIYLVDSYISSSNAFLIPINYNSKYSQFGRIQFNRSNKYPSDVGYMYGDYPLTESNLSTKHESTVEAHSTLMINSSSITSSYWFADSINIDSINHKYSLVNPYHVTSSDQYSGLIGKYVSFSQSYSNIYEIGYIVNVNNSNIYFKHLGYGNPLSYYEPIVFGSSITDNGDGTFSLNNTVNIYLSDWYNNYSNYNKMYICNDGTSSCSSPRYVYETSLSSFQDIIATKMIVVAKNREGLSLQDTILLRFSEFIKNSDDYSEYKYTCDNENTVCTSSNLRLITGFNKGSYYYSPNYYYGSDVLWNGNQYTLVDPIELENYNNYDTLSTHHYMCVTPGSVSCETVAYVYNYDYSQSRYLYHIILTNGSTNPIIELENMLENNSYNSTIKNAVDFWYKKYILSYDNFIEDTIYCNDRSYNNSEGWNPVGGLINHSLIFNGNDLLCSNIFDRFSVSNSNAHLSYKVGLISRPEMRLLNNNKARKANDHYWVLTPSSLSYSALNSYISSYGYFNSSYVSGSYGLRPAISLKPGTVYSSGDGSMANPYVVDTN